MSEHDGCSATFENGQQTVDKVRQMGFSEGLLPMSHQIKCQCGTTFEMEYFEDKCPDCSMVYGVTPCHSHDPAGVKAAGIDY